MNREWVNSRWESWTNQLGIESKRSEIELSRAWIITPKICKRSNIKRDKFSHIGIQKHPELEAWCITRQCKVKRWDRRIIRKSVLQSCHTTQMGIVCPRHIKLAEGERLFSSEIKSRSITWKYRVRNFWPWTLYTVDVMKGEARNWW